MPTYEYEREDGTRFDVIQRMTDPVIDKCPLTGQKVKRLINNANLHFKGTGFYKTDYGKK